MTNTLAVGLVFMVLFQKTEYTDGLINLLIQWSGGNSVDFISGPYWAKNDGFVHLYHLGGHAV